MSKTVSALLEKAGGLKYVLIVAAVGLLLLLWPSGQSSLGAQEQSGTEEARLEALLTQITGVGQTELLLSESGAVIVCEGADSTAVCLQITQAVRCYTGLGADRVEIFKLK